MKKLMAMAMAGMMVLSMAACGSSKRGRIHGSSDCWHG